MTGKCKPCKRHVGRLAVTALLLPLTALPNAYFNNVNMRFDV